MSATQSPVEFADGRGHPDFPVLSAIDSPMSRVPCVDFSSWLADRIAAGDADAAGEWAALVIEANPGLGVGVSPDHGCVVAARQAVAGSLAGLTLAAEAEADLRTAMALWAPHGDMSRFDLVKPDGGRFLAAAMAPHDVSFETLAEAVALANRIIAEMQGEEYPPPAWEGLPPLEVSEVRVPSVAGDADVLEVVRELTVVSRSHLADLAQLPPKRLEGTNEVDGWAPWYATRSLGCDPEQGVAVLRAAGVLAETTDPQARRAYVEKSTTANDLREMLTEAGVTFPKSAAKKRLIALADEHLAGVLDARAEEMSLLELTDLGSRAVVWAGERTAAAQAFWSVWMASHDRDAPT